MVARDIPLTRGTRFPPHRHDVHQLAWAARGVISVTVAGRIWVLPATRALWIPAGTPHGLEGGPAVARAVYLDRSPRGWRRPTPVAVTPLLRELAGHLARTAGTAAPAARRRAEAVLLDLLEPVRAATIDVPMPGDPRAVAVAEALLAAPDDPRSLAAWGRDVGAAGRTLARLFEAETGMSFGRWRTNVRLRAAMLLLAAGEPVAVVAHRVGYATPSAFIATFRRQLGTTPGAFYG